MILCNSEHDTTNDQTSDSACLLYAVIREKAVGVTLNICGTPERRSHLYTTSTSTIEISIITESGIEGRSPFFMLEFQGTVQYPHGRTL